MDFKKSTSGFGVQQVEKDNATSEKGNATGGMWKMQQVEMVIQQVKRRLDQIELFDTRC